MHANRITYGVAVRTYVLAPGGSMCYSSRNVHWTEKKYLQISSPAACLISVEAAWVKSRVERGILILNCISSFFR